MPCSCMSFMPAVHMDGLEATSKLSQQYRLFGAPGTYGKSYRHAPDSFNDPEDQSNPGDNRCNLKCASSHCHARKLRELATLVT